MNPLTRLRNVSRRNVVAGIVGVGGAALFEAGRIAVDKLVIDPLLDAPQRDPFVSTAPTMQVREPVSIVGNGDGETVVGGLGLDPVEIVGDFGGRPYMVSEHGRHYTVGGGWRRESGA
jgi:hypothetical protein